MNSSERCAFLVEKFGRFKWTSTLCLMLRIVLILQMYSEVCLEGRMISYRKNHVLAQNLFSFYFLPYFYKQIHLGSWLIICQLQNPAGSLYIYKHKEFQLKACNITIGKKMSLYTDRMLKWKQYSTQGTYVYMVVWWSIFLKNFQSKKVGFLPTNPNNIRLVYRHGFRLAASLIVYMLEKFL